MSTLVTHVEHVMGMAVSIDIRDPAPVPGAVEAVCAWLHEVDATFSTYRDDSVITRFSRGELEIEDLPPHVLDVLLTCIELTNDTCGMFDAFAVPAPNDTTLDPSGYVKGWAVERAAALLEERGATNFSINAGGDIALRGEPAPGTPWKIGIRHPAAAHNLATFVELVGPIAVATSATYERGAHIIDPRTGDPTTAIASVTVVGADLGRADAFATASFVMGPDSLRWIEEQPGYELYLITHDGSTHWSTGFPHN